MTFHAAGQVHIIVWVKYRIDLSFKILIFVLQIVQKMALAHTPDLYTINHYTCTVHWLGLFTRQQGEGGESRCIIACSMQLRTVWYAGEMFLCSPYKHSTAHSSLASHICIYNDCTLPSRQEKVPATKKNTNFS